MRWGWGWGGEWGAWESRAGHKWTYWPFCTLDFILTREAIGIFEQKRNIQALKGSLVLCREVVYI